MRDRRTKIRLGMLALGLATAVLTSGCTPGRSETKAVGNDHSVDAPLKTYEIPYTEDAPRLNGDLESGAWAAAPWSSDFRDIQGPSMPDPRFRTRMKMLWDDEYLYVGAHMEEPHLWATYDVHDMIVFHEHDFEVFIDPTGDTREYYEIEVNVLGTIFDLFLYQTYREGGPAEHGWHCEGLITVVHAEGTLNDPSDEDTSWVVEWAIPFASLVPPGPVEGPEGERAGRTPRQGDSWRINFSRVQWQLLVEDGSYVKRPDTPEDNWTWAPQGEINMHAPEHWGYARFMGPGSKRKSEQ